MNTSGPPVAQTGLFGSPAAMRAPLHRLFFALLPDAATRHEINHAAAQVQQQHPGLRARWVRPERFHATLNFLGDFSVVPDEVLAKAMAAADGVHSVPFNWTLDYVASFRGREPPCVLRGAEVPQALLALWRSMHAALQGTGLHLRSERQFTPHVTLAYARQALPAATPVTPVVWQARRFALVRSLVGQGSYQTVGSWALGHGPQVT
jgi:2'-5' RNA ligase